MIDSPAPIDIVAQALECAETPTEKASLARDLLRFSLAAVASLEGSFTAADEAQRLADAVRFK